MQGLDRPGLTCPRDPDVTCAVGPCPGLDDPGVCAHLGRLAAWRALSPAEQASRRSTPAPAIDPALRDAVNACPDRGPVLPLPEQDDCGCRGRELSLCRAGRGAKPGRVTLRDCLECRGATGRGGPA